MTYPCGAPMMAAFPGNPVTDNQRKRHTDACLACQRIAYEADPWAGPVHEAEMIVRKVGIVTRPSDKAVA